MSWNGYRAALSLTFDDGLPCQREHAIPRMSHYGMQGTFFVIPEPPADFVKEEFPVWFWRKAVAAGHEVGSHSMTHRKAAELTPKQALSEAMDSRKFLINHFDIPCDTYCHPYTDAPAHVQAACRQAGYIAARGGRVARTDKYITKGDGVNLFNTPCFHVNEGLFDHGVIYAYIDAALERQAWLTLMFHGVGPDVSQWDNVTSPRFEELMKFLVDRREKGLWVATYGDAAREYSRA